MNVLIVLDSKSTHIVVSYLQNHFVFFNLKYGLFVLEIFSYLDASNHSIYQLRVFILASNSFLHLQVILITLPP